VVSSTGRPRRRPPGKSQNGPSSNCSSTWRIGGNTSGGAHRCLGHSDMSLSSGWRAPPCMCGCGLCVSFVSYVLMCFGLGFVFAGRFFFGLWTSSVCQVYRASSRESCVVSEYVVQAGSNALWNQDFTPGHFTPGHCDRACYFDFAGSRVFPKVCRGLLSNVNRRNGPRRRDSATRRVGNGRIVGATGAPSRATTVWWGAPCENVSECEILRSE
jgi:hypothetical protein